MGHPDFRVNKKIFATLGYPDGHWAMVKLTPEQQTAFVESAPDVFVPVKGGWGLKGATNVRLPAATRRALGPALATAWRNVAPRRAGRIRVGTPRTPEASSREVIACS